jgi:pyruvate,water dikinase
MSASPLVVGFEHLRASDVDTVGGKNSSLGEMISQLASAGVRVPGGFATTAEAFRRFLAGSDLTGRIAKELESLDTNDVRALAKAGKSIRQLIIDAPFPADLEKEIRDNFQKLADDSSGEMSFAVRSSATAEDLPDASFAGQQETFLNVHGIEDVMVAIKEVFASLYNDRAISYRVHSPLGWGPAHGAKRSGCSRRDVHARYRVGF